VGADRQNLGREAGSVARVPLHVVSAGAAKALVESLGDAFAREHGPPLASTFGAVGAMKDKLLAGAPCDVVILTHAMLEQLAAGGHVLRETIVPLGWVRTGIAVPAGETPPSIGDAAALKGALLASPAIYVPDPERATAGIHFMTVLDRLGIRAEVGQRLRPYPNGATAMAELARASEPGSIGCTQVTEIKYTPGVTLVGTLPQGFDIATLYSAGVAVRASSNDVARRFVERIAGESAAVLRRSSGFEEAT
jgi:molybdate transport system substrate-binding protein